MKIQDFDFQNQCPSIVVDKGLEWLRTNYHLFRSHANFAIISGDTLKGNISQACHGAILSEEVPKNRDCIATENGIIRRWGEGPYPEGVAEFLQWFVHKSWFSRFILNKDDVTHGFVISADIPCNLLQNMNIITRHFYECGEPSFKVFKHLLDLGYSGDVAYGFAFNTNISLHYNTTSSASTKEFNFGDEQIYGYAGHRAWEVWHSIKSLRNFLTGEFGETFGRECDPKFHFRNYATIMGGAQYCGNTSYGRSVISEVILQPECKDRLAEYRKVNGSQAKIKNPFSKPDFTKPQQHPALVNYNELIEIVLPYMKEKNILDV